MMQDPITKIIIIEDAAEDAEQIISVLRNGGIAVRPQRVTSEEEFIAALESLSPDLVLANPDSREVPYAAIARAIETTGKDMALLALAGQITEDFIAQAFASGTRGIALRKRPEQIQAVVRRELDALNMRRSVRRLESSLRESERRCDSLLDSSRDPIAYVHEGTHVRANRAYLEMFGFEDFEEVEGLTLLDLIAPAHTADFKDLLKRLSRGEKPPPRLELTAQRADGSTFDAVMEFSSASYEGEACLQIVFRRQEVDPELARQLEEMKSRDPLTGLYNRSHFIGLIDQAVKATVDGGKNYSLLLLEPDNFQTVNDAVGISGTDALLRAMAAAVNANLAQHDHAGRIGEHAFGVLLAARPHTEVQRVAEAIRASVEGQIVEAAGHSVSLTASVGGTLLGEKNANTQTLLAQASHALRNAQSQGGNRSDIHDPAATDKAEAAKEREWLERIDAALVNDGFALYYQSVISLHGAEREFFEVLLRLHGPSGEVLPAFFLPIADRHGRLPAIDRWVIGRAIDVLAERGNRSVPTTLFVKLSADSLQDEQLANWIGERLQATGVPGSALVFEMPESKVVTSLKPARELVEQLKQHGCAFALEQFGSGLNSFQLLKHIDADYLKLDRSFTRDLPKHEENQQKVRELCMQADEAGKHTIAEWVEDAASMSILFSAGVHFVQGNFLQEPDKAMNYVA
ncbi:MAG TPA: bifunctional diguanylate cyclase/phosphodiesterase [Rhodanobacteraceae bacterium]|nr:bifunctional diguanylate cyclase/phosphodiesterase [Rhodanobacteraceae bacterium]